MRNRKDLKKIAAAFVAALVLGAVPYGFAHASGGHSHWSYEGKEGPANWGKLSKDYAACSEGKSQSPIDISRPQAGNLKDIAFGYKATKLNILNNGHTIQVNADEGSSITVNGVKYNLVQFHFHTPSEHTIGAKSFAMELHLVHKNDKGELAVVGVLLDAGAENPAYKDIVANIPKKADEKKTVNVSYNISDLLPKERLFYTYPGSLTTPPCTEGVTWLVLKSPVQASKAQIDALHAVMHTNSRPVQPVNNRVVKEDSSAD